MASLTGAQLTAVGGRLVYSTCSFNPIENEAVVAELLRSCGGALELVDVSEQLPLLRRAPGLTSWRVMEKQGGWIDSHDDVPEGLRRSFKRSMWPPEPAELSSLHLERCVRVFPHYQDTGGFFIAVFEKVGKIPPGAGESRPAAAPMAREADARGEGAALTDSPQVPLPRPTATAAAAAAEDDEHETPVIDEKVDGQSWGYKEDPYYFQDQDGDYWPAIKDFYGFGEAFPAGQLLTRSAKTKRNIYYVSELVKRVIENNACGEGATLRIINAGVKSFTKSDARDAPCDYRLCMDGLSAIWPMMSQRVVSMPLEDIAATLEGDGCRSENLTVLGRAQIETVTKGCTVLKYTPGGTEDIGAMQGAISCPLQVLVWRSDKGHLKTLVSKDDRAMIRLLLGTEPEELPSLPPPAQPATAAASPSYSPPAAIYGPAARKANKASTAPQ